ncbi:GntR family transcriptional regulator [Pedomonas mirosovicensis]|uniref:GntR family transcriptional regulator n=1 Tax=Pedomonas mirosovicensis TaxID=2908641 RepID=UPI0021686234|nr:GntR family transcriptional regulator [Pedomonas mirosovicensis]MCH8686578.1 GntR family transcriptional regulator [Pedomonas mirosovicensis]
MSSLIVRNLSDQLVELVRDRILSGQVPADKAIRQDALAAELGVSKIPLREALARLEQEGLLRSQANRGFFVRPLSTAEAEEVYALRLKLEPDAVAQASVHASEAERRFAVETLETLDRVTDAHGSGVGAFNRAFHLALIRPSGLTVTTNFLERLHILSDRYVRKHLEPLGRDERANEEHAKLLETWLSRDSGAVAELMRQHISETLEDLRKQLPAEA